MFYIFNRFCLFKLPFSINYCTARMVFLKKKTGKNREKNLAFLFLISIFRTLKARIHKTSVKMEKNEVSRQCSRECLKLTSWYLAVIRSSALPAAAVASFFFSARAFEWFERLREHWNVNNYFSLQIKHWPRKVRTGHGDRSGWVRSPCRNKRLPIRGFPLLRLCSACRPSGSETAYSEAENYIFVVFEVLAER